MDYRKTAQEIYDHIGKKKTLFLQPTVPHVFDWLSLIIRRQIRNMLRTLKVLKVFSLHRDRCRLFWEQVWLIKYMMSSFRSQVFLRAVKRI